MYSLVIGFAYFYTSITFNPMEVADNMKKQGGFILVSDLVNQQQEYLNNILNYIVFIGAIGLLIVATNPIVLWNVLVKANFNRWNINDHYRWCCS